MKMLFGLVTISIAVIIACLLCGLYQQGRIDGIKEIQNMAVQEGVGKYIYDKGLKFVFITKHEEDPIGSQNKCLRLENR